MIERCMDMVIYIPEFQRKWFKRWWMFCYHLSGFYRCYNYSNRLKENKCFMTIYERREVKTENVSLTSVVRNAEIYNERCNNRAI